LSFYELNINAIKEVNASFADWLENQPNDDWIESIFCDDGITPNLLIKLPLHNRRITIYDQYNPKEGPKVLADQAERYKQNSSIILGFGLGYTIQAILNKAEEEHTIFVAEPNATILKKALSIFDYSEQIKKKELLICGQNTNEIITTLNSIEGRFSGGDIYMNQESYVDSLPEIYSDYKEIIVKTINQIRSNITTVIQKGNEIALNELKSLSHAVRSRGVGTLFGIFKGKPAILVSTGPSLAKNIHLLKEASKGAVIIAVVQALKALLAYDIVPDFVTIIDYQGELNRPHFEGIFSSQVPLIALCRANSDIVKEYKGPKFIVGAPYGQPDYYLSRFWQLKGIVSPGNSVAHMNFVLAHAMGADPIVFVGQDLAISTTTHFNQIDHNSDVALDSGKMTTTLTDKRSKWDGYIPESEVTLAVPGYYENQTAITRLVLFSFLASFEQMVSQVQSKVINSTEGGVKIKGTERMSLADVIAKYCQEDLDRSKVHELSSTPPEDANMLTEQLIPFLEQERQIFLQLIGHCEAGIVANNRITKKHNKNISLSLSDPDLMKNNEHSIAAQTIAKNIPFLSMSIFGVETEAKKREVNIPYDESKPETAIIRLKRNRDILTSVLKAAREMEQIYDYNIDLFKKYVEYSKDASSLNLFRLLKDMGDWVGAKKALKEILKEPTSKILEEAITFAMDIEDFSSIQKYEVDNRQKIELVIDDLLKNNDADLKAGNFARPILYAKKVLSYWEDHPTALKHFNEAIQMRNKQIEIAKENYVKAQHDTTISEEANIVNEYLRLIEESRQLGREKKYDESIIPLNKASELLPNRPEAKWGLASTYYFTGKVEEAEKVYQELLVMFPDNDQFTFELGLTQIRLEKLIEGTNNVEMVMVRNPTFDWFLAGIAVVNVSLGNYNRAIIQFEKYLQIVPGDYVAWFQYGGTIQLLANALWKEYENNPKVWISAWCYEVKSREVLDYVKKIKPDIEGNEE